MDQNDQAKLIAIKEALYDRQFRYWEGNLKFLISWVESLLKQLDEANDRIKGQKKLIMRLTRGNMPGDTFCVFCGAPNDCAGCTNKKCGIRQ